VSENRGIVFKAHVPAIAIGVDSKWADVRLTDWTIGLLLQWPTTVVYW